MKKPLSRSLRAFFGVGNFGYQFLVNIETAFFAIFLTDTVQFPIYMVGIIMMTASIADFIIAPFSGALISGTKPMKWGRIRSWMLVSPPLVVVFYLLQFSNFGNGYFSAALIIFGYIVSHALWNIAFTADIAIIAEIAPNKEDRLLLGSRRMMFNNLGRMFSSYFTPAILVFLTLKLGNENTAYSVLIIFACVVLCLSFWTDFKMTKGYEGQSIQASARKADFKDKLSLREIVDSFVKNP
ncbi:MAG TPA: MFS transporter, partial [Syntrophomonas sp.]|nr:MFS transporter [Syntrophomonas sp.]